MAAWVKEEEKASENRQSNTERERCTRRTRFRLYLG